MQYDICLKCASLDIFVAALLPFDLATSSGELITASHDHALQYVGRVIQTPAVIDVEGNVTAEPVYYGGEYAILRAKASILSRIMAATLTGIMVVPLPAGCPTFGDWQPVPAVDLDRLRAEACDRIDTVAELRCNQVITPGSAQMARYQRKEGQARAYLAAIAAGQVPLEPAALAAFEASFPAVYGEVGITADTPEAVARTIVAMADAWWTYGDAVELARLAGKRAVEAAGTPAAVTDALEAVAWPPAPANDAGSAI